MDHGWGVRQRTYRLTGLEARLSWGGPSAVADKTLVHLSQVRWERGVGCLIFSDLYDHIFSAADSKS